MIDLWNVLTHSLWIAGAAMALASWSWADWRNAARTAGSRDWAAAAVWNPGIAFGLALACLGAGLGVTPWWEQVLWILMAAGLAWHGVRALRRGRGLRA